MSREIKFRVWDNQENTMFYNEDILNIQFAENFIRIENEKYAFNSFLDEVILMQYIGLKDCNGKEIYEGDIVEDNFGDRYEVVFEDYKFNLKDFYCGCFDIPNDGFSELRDKLKVIGNIYEDGDLMEVR